MGEKNIIAECYGDTLLIKQLKYEFFAYHSGIGEVANQMKKYPGNKRAIAIIDNDKNRQPGYFKSECEHIKTENGIIFLKHRQVDHFVIKIDPAFEGFINTAAKECGFELFQKDQKKFQRIIKDRNLHSNIKFVNYLNKIIARNPSGIKTLKKFIAEAQNERPFVTSSIKRPSKNKSYKS